MDRHVPLSRRRQGLGASGPHDGVPGHLHNSLWRWLLLFTQTQGGFVHDPTVDALERNIEVDVPRGHRRLQNLETLFVNEPEKFLDAVDYLLSSGRVQRHSRSAIEGLKALLSEAGSLWGVFAVDGNAFRLEERVEATARQAYEDTVAPNDRASSYLLSSWGYGYSRDPNASSCYRDAIRAVEVVAKQVILPNDESATLGRVIGHLRTLEAGAWDVAFNPPEGDARQWTLGMLDLLWKSQGDRHGTDDEDAPLEVTLDEARAALHMAVTLVQWFRVGAIRLT